MPVTGLVYRLVKGLPLTAFEGDDRIRRLANFENALEAIIGVVLDPDGTLKNGAVDSAAVINDRIITYAKLANILTGVLAGGPAAYTTTITPAPPSGYVSGDLYILTTGATANTGPVTINVNALGALGVTKLSGAPLDAGDFPSNGAILLVCLGATFALVSSSNALVGPSSITPGVDYQVLKTVAGVTDWANLGSTLPPIPLPAVTGVTNMGLHNMGQVPDFAQFWIECVTANNGFIKFDRVELRQVYTSIDDNEHPVLQPIVGPTVVSIACYNPNNGYVILSASSGAKINIFPDIAKWQIVGRLIRF